MNMKRLLVAVCALPLALAGCFEDKELDLVVTGETYTDFSQDETSESWGVSAILDVGEQIRDILEENGYTDESVMSARITSVHYGVTSFIQAHDWMITGEIKVAYDGSTATILTYSSQSVQEALGEKISVPLESAGVDLVNRALDDFVNGENPVITFIIENDTTTPEPVDGDPMTFDWRSWLAIQLILTQGIEDVPDPL
jgi:hypothetical protein